MLKKYRGLWYRKIGTCSDCTGLYYWQISGITKKDKEIFIESYDGTESQVKRYIDHLQGDKVEFPHLNEEGYPVSMS